MEQILSTNVVTTRRITIKMYPQDILQMLRDKGVQAPENPHATVISVENVEVESDIPLEIKWETREEINS